jgi:hypothetical protein
MVRRTKAFTERGEVKTCLVAVATKLAECFVRRASADTADKYFVNVKTLLLAGRDISPAALKAIFQDDSEQTNLLDASEAQVKQQRAKQKAARKLANATRQNLKAYLLGSYGVDALQMLQDFGFSLPKPRGGKKAASTKAQAVVLAKATRAARHTMGKNQKAKIRGSVPTQPTTPAVSPSATPSR